MQISLRNLSTEARIVPYLPAIAAALTEQLSHHFGPTWEQTFRDVTVIGPKDGADGAIISLYDDADQAGELGDHELDSGKPTGRIFVKTILDSGGTMTEGPNSVSSVISHEACEIGGDPYANWWSDFPSGDLVALEACDPVEDESYKASNGVALSNFVGPRWFRDGPGPFDWLKTRTKPFQVSGGGYIILRDEGAVFGQQAERARRSYKEARRIPNDPDLQEALFGARIEIAPPAPAHDPNYKMIFVGGKYRRVKA